MKIRVQLRRVLLLCILSPLSPVVSIDAHADDSSSAIQSTQNILRDKSSRETAISSDPRAKAADQSVDQVAGTPQNKEEMYDIAADLMPWLIQSTNGGDPEALSKMLSEAQGNPEVFYARLPAAQKERIKKLAEKIGTSKKP